MRFLTQKIQNTTEGKIVQNFLLDGWLDSACIGKVTGSTTYCVMVIMSPRYFQWSKINWVGRNVRQRKPSCSLLMSSHKFQDHSISYAPGAVAYIDILPVLSGADPGFLEGGIIIHQEGVRFQHFI